MGWAGDPRDGALLLATHEGMFRYDADRPKRIGPLIDLMGFTIAGPAHYYASGRANVVLDLPQPVGLIASRAEAAAGRSFRMVASRTSTR